MFDSKLTWTFEQTIIPEQLEDCLLMSELILKLTFVVAFGDVTASLILEVGNCAKRSVRDLDQTLEVDFLSLKWIRLSSTVMLMMMAAKWQMLGEGWQAILC